MTECSQTQFEFASHFSRAVVADFDGGRLTSDGGALLLRQVDRRINLLPRLAKSFTDFRSPERIEHGVEQMLAQRVYGLALGYEDLNDHDQLDAVLHLARGAVELLVQFPRFPFGGGNRSDHVTRILLALDPLGLGHHAPLRDQLFTRAIAELGEHPRRFAVRLDSAAALRIALPLSKRSRSLRARPKT